MAPGGRGGDVSNGVLVAEREHAVDAVEHGEVLAGGTATDGAYARSGAGHLGAHLDETLERRVAAARGDVVGLETSADQLAVERDYVMAGPQQLVDDLDSEEASASHDQRAHVEPFRRG